MQPKKAIIVLIVIFITSGLFFIWLYSSGRLNFSKKNQPATEKEENRPLTPAEKAGQVVELAEKMKTMDTASATPAEKAKEVTDLADTMKAMDNNDGSDKKTEEVKKQEAQEVMNLADIMKSME